MSWLIVTIMEISLGYTQLCGHKELKKTRKGDDRNFGSVINTHTESSALVTQESSI